MFSKIRSPVYNCSNYIAFIYILFSSPSCPWNLILDWIYMDTSLHLHISSCRTEAEDYRSLCAWGMLPKDICELVQFRKHNIFLLLVTNSPSNLLSRSGVAVRLKPQRLHSAFKGLTHGLQALAQPPCLPLFLLMWQPGSSGSFFLFQHSFCARRWYSMGGHG